MEGHGKSETAPSDSLLGSCSTSWAIIVNTFCGAGTLASVVSMICSQLCDLESRISQRGSSGFHSIPASRNLLKDPSAQIRDIQPKAMVST